MEVEGGWQDPRTPRLKAVYNRFRAAGCCGLCSLYYGLRTVERLETFPDTIELPHCKTRQACAQARQRATRRTAVTL